LAMADRDLSAMLDVELRLLLALDSEAKPS
jgi:hypothetical protein